MFDINPYSISVENKTANREILTITWHIDDLKISNINGQVVIYMIK